MAWRRLRKYIKAMDERNPMAIKHSKTLNLWSKNDVWLKNFFIGSKCTSPTEQN